MIPVLPSLARAAGIVLVCMSGALASDVDPDIIAAQTGHWLLAPLDGRPGCSLTLTKDETIGGFAVTGAEACATALPALADTYAWNFSNGGMVLIDPTRKVLATFEESEGEPWQTTGDDALALVLPPGKIDRLPTQMSLAGRWLLQRPDGEKLCMVQLDAGDGDGTLSTVGDCVAAVKHLKLQYWQINSFDVTLMSDQGETLTFTMTADGNFEKTKESGGKSLLLLRQ